MWLMIVVTAKQQGRVTATSSRISRSSRNVGRCARPRCPCHSEIELVTIARSSSAFCPSCATAGWWSASPMPQDRTQALLSSVGQWTLPVLMNMSQLQSSKVGAKPSSLAQLTIPYTGEMSTSPCPSPGPGSGEDTFTLGGVYIGSLESHVRTHQAFCSGMNVRSQGCQTGEKEVSPPVIEWRMHPTPSMENLNPETFMSDIGVQCNTQDVSAASNEQPINFMLKLAGEVCIRDARTRLAGRTHIEAGRSVPAFLLICSQLILWLPVFIASLTLELENDMSVRGWRIIICAVCVANLAPALGPLLYFLSARCSRAF